MAIGQPLSPPGNDNPVADDGQHTHSWLGYHQDVSDVLNGLHTGVVTGVAASAGEVGEVMSGTATVAVLASAASTNIVNLNLTPGDWDVTGNIAFTPAPTTPPTDIAAGISLSSGVLPAVLTRIATAFATGALVAIDAGGVRQVNISVNTLVYLVGRASFTVAGMAATGTIRARRMR
jgi:hypothetical protein